jgi:hypothetical protein
VKAPTPFKRRMRDHPITKLFHPWQRWKRCVVLFMMVRGVLKMEVRLGFNESFFFSSHFSLSYPKNSRYPFQKSIMPFSLYFYQIWHLFFLLPFVLLLILLKVFFFNFILRHFNSYNLFIQFDPYSFDCVFFVFYPWFICFSISPLIILFYFFYFGPYYFDYYFLIFFFIFLFFLSTFYFILFYYPILVLILFILFFLNFFFNLVPNYFLPFSFYIRFGPYCFDCYLFCS